MKKCDNCNGEGLVGQGDKPWLQQGRLETCGACKGTGKVEEAAPAAEAEIAAPAEPVNDPESSTVDSNASDPLAVAPGAEASSEGSSADGAATEAAPAAETV